ncbi:hypothetical protein [Verrucomicrobium spinosum]|uniref:hypothetical protein n=1 Tax=Verrucomicrobium spinosum TaxID=2736 RepID=UPI001C49374A|nr:hypothetical protein [Verrucomicrobium spinosum]
MPLATFFVDLILFILGQGVELLFIEVDQAGVLHGVCGLNSPLGRLWQPAFDVHADIFQHEDKKPRWLMPLSSWRTIPLQDPPGERRVFSCPQNFRQSFIGYTERDGSPPSCSRLSVSRFQLVSRQLLQMLLRPRGDLTRPIKT